MQIFEPLYFYAFLIILATTVGVELSIRKFKANAFYGRKILHLVSICTCAYVVHHSTEPIVLSYLFLVFGIILLLLIKKNAFATSQTKSYGIALFPFAFFILLQLDFLTSEQKVFGILTLGISDAVAGAIGYTFGKSKFVGITETKSPVGFISFYASTIAILLWQGNTDWTVLLIALIPAMSELFSHKGSDNLSIPIVSSVWYYVVANADNNLLVQNIAFATGIIILAILAFYKKWLTVSGAIAALFVGFVIIFTSGVIYLLPLAVFLISGSLASKLLQDKAEKTGRNAKQVFANGIVAVVCLVAFTITKNEIYHIAFFASIAIGMADTISSDIGRYFKQPTFNIINGKSMPVGISGGISVAGTVAGLVAAIVFATIVYFEFNISIVSFITIAVVGFVGMLVDSVLGSLLQAAYKTSANELTESKADTLTKGFTWCDNDMVNVLSNVLTIAIAVVCCR